MLQIVKRLSLGLSLIAIASAILLFSDAPRRSLQVTHSSGSAADRVYKIALLQMASQPIMEDGAAGVLAGLRERGYMVGQNIEVRRLNAEGDTATANTMAQEVTSGGYDLVMTLSTSCLQAVANANKQGRVPHVFCLVSDPRASGVGIGDQPLDHPAHLVGLGTLPPATESLEIAKQINPKLSRIGVVWNPSEVNSEISTRMAREACAKLKMELLEANAENTSSVKEAAVSLTTRGVDALWIGGDVTVLAATDVVVKVAKAASIPVFTCIPGNIAKGTLFDVGANYYEVGRSTGHLAAQVLGGESIAKLPVQLAIPPRLMLNKLALAGLGPLWSFPQALLDRADSILDEQGQHDKLKPLLSQAKVEIVSYISTQDTEEAIAGLRDGLKQAQLTDGKDFELRISSAQGDMATLNTLVDAALTRQPDLILTVSTQALQGVSKRTRSTPIVFTMVANPFQSGAGVGETDTDHHPLITGAYGANDVDAMLPIIQQLLPKAKRIGALFNPAESNSAYSHKLLVAAMKQADLELISLPINSPSDVPDAAQSLCAQQIDLICLPNSNLAGTTFPSIARAAQRAKLPVFAFLGGLASQGASVVLTRDFHDMGVDSGEIAARVLRGESPAAVSFHRVTKSRLIVNPAAAAECGLILPDELIQRADKVIKP